MTLTKRPLVLLLVGLLSACGGDELPLDELRADSRPYYWVGESFEDLELSHAGPYGGRLATFAYGTCEPPGGLFAEGGCAPPLQVQNVLCEDGSARVALFSHGGGLSARAAKALRPLNAAARRGGKPLVTFDRSVLC